MLAMIETDCNGTPKPIDGGEYVLMEKQWRCVGCRAYVDGHNGHLRCWGHLKMLTYQNIPTPWPWAQQMLLEKGWIELEPGAAAAAWLERQQREMVQTAQMPRQIPGPPPGSGPNDDLGPPPPPPQKLQAPPPPPGPVPQEIERLQSEVAALTVEIKRQNSEVAALTVVIERLVAAVEQNATAAAAGRQTGVPSQSEGNIIRRKGYVSSWASWNAPGRGRILRKTTGESGLGRVNSKKPAIEEDTYAVLRVTGQDTTAAADLSQTEWWWHNGEWQQGTWEQGTLQ